MKTNLNILNWNDFPSSDKTEWHRQIQSENKDVTIESLNHIIQNSFTGLAFANQDDIPNTLHPIQISVKSNHWKTGFNIQNKLQLISALEFGVDYINIETILENKQIVENILDGILIDLLYFRWAVPDLESCYKVYSWLEKKYSTSERFSITPNCYNDIEIIKSIREKIPVNINFIFSVESLQNWSNRIHRIVSFVLLLIQSGIENPFKHVWIMIAPSNDFLTTICAIRALRACLQKVAEDLNIQSTLNIESIIEISNHINNQSSLISSTSKTLSVALAGSEIITCKFSKPLVSNIQNTMKNQILIQQILRSESHIDHVVDPLAGSYYIENLTEKMASNWWNNLNY